MLHLCLIGCMTVLLQNICARISQKNLEECREFIAESQHTELDFHMAITNDVDEYVGTVSLKHITSLAAEFAIVIRKSAMRTGVSQYAMKEIIKIGFEKLNLKCIYWCVLPENKRAICFYDKNGYHKVPVECINAPLENYYTPEEIEKYIWYETRVAEV